MTSANQFRALPIAHGSRDVFEVVNSLRDGKVNSTGSVTLAANAATTTVADLRAGQDSVILFMPITANAAAAAGGMHVSTRAKQSFTITHANNAQTDRTFGYVVLG